MIIVQNSNTVDEPDSVQWNADNVEQIPDKKKPAPAKGKAVEEEPLIPPKPEVRLSDFDILKMNPIEGAKVQNIHELK